MARRKRITAGEWIDQHPYPDTKQCDHCGTVERALKLWGKEIETTCPCACHWAKQYDKENKR